MTLAITSVNPFDGDTTVVQRRCCPLTDRTRPAMV